MFNLNSVRLMRLILVIRNLSKFKKKFSYNFNLFLHAKGNYKNLGEFK